MTTTATTTARKLATALATVLPFATLDETLPLLRSVRIEAGCGILTTTATDRYSIGHARQEATGTLPPFVLDAPTAQTLLDALHRVIDDRGTGRDLATITVADGAPRRVTFAFRNIEISAPEVTRADKFPDLAAIVADTTVTDTAFLDGPAALSFHTLRRLHAAMEVINGLTDWDSPPARWHFNGPRNPVRVEVNDWFLAVLMPVHMRDGEPNVPFGLANELAEVAR